MKVLHVNNLDLTGQRFNGYNLIGAMEEFDINCDLTVLRKESNNPHVHQLLNTRRDLRLMTALEQYEKEHSLCKVSYPWAECLFSSKPFQNADVVHLHLVHNNLISIFDIEQIAAQKPTVWTWHDPWPLTGHCIHPLDCTGWQTGCTVCSHLNYTFPIISDTAAAHFKAKLRVAQNTDISIIMASKWLESLALQSAIGQAFSHRYLVPFGLDASALMLARPAEEYRKELGIKPTSTVIFFRSDNVAFKGVDYIISALDILKHRSDIALITVGNRQLPREITERYHCVQFPWQNDQVAYYSLLNACDFMLMPSIAETFGMMALEAMALGKPVIAFKGTALEELIDDGRNGLTVPSRDAQALAEAIERLASDKVLRAKLGTHAVAKFSSKYTFEAYKKQLAHIYRETIQRWSKQHVSTPKHAPRDLVEHAGELLESYDSIALPEVRVVRTEELKQLIFFNSIKGPLIAFLKKIHLINVAVGLKRILRHQEK